ncbi:cyclin-D2-1-like isoform X1 [Panicum miliaceum]|uniref:Cyclin-D2-1-like isoform X1 n=1 Tax=Panicum miliaceum TaxID=4540 RepID=A0A3L6TBS3_PANMI|nr:cyclin-D2-1-like isoform X1 [Panicum miliaceum]
MPDDAAYLLCAEDAAAAFFGAAGSACTGADDDDDGSCCSAGEEESAASIAELIGGEADYSPRPDYPDRLRSRSIDPAARAESVAWILKVQEYYGFLPLTAYLAVNYMDRFLSVHHLPQEDGWAMELLAVTCLSLAAKMEETLVPSLLDLQAITPLTQWKSSSENVEGISRYVFEPGTIGRMELLVLTALNWRLRSVTPFTFIDFFAYKVDPGGRHARCLIARATQVILAAMHDIEFLDHCPSSMAAAAVLCATGETPSLESVSPGAAVRWCIGLAEEAISSCYRLMQQLVIGNVQTRAASTTASAANQCCSDEVLSSHSSSSSSPPPAKRRKRSPPGV